MIFQLTKLIVKAVFLVCNSCKHDMYMGIWLIWCWVVGWLILCSWIIVFG